MANELANVAAVNTGIKNQFISTLDMDSVAGKIKVQRAYANADSLNDVPKDTILKICDVIITPGIRKGRKGAKDTECQNTYLIDIDGNAYFTQSDGIARDVNFIMYIFDDMGKSTEQGYLNIQIIEKKLGNGNTIKNAVLCD